MAKLYVGNLPFQTTDAELKTLFAQAGEVTRATVVIDKFTNRSRGFGFVEFTDDASAKKAIESLNGRDLGGRPLKVAEAKPQESRGDGGGGGGYGGGGGGGYSGGQGGGGGNRGPRRF